MRGEQGSMNSAQLCRFSQHRVATHIFHFYAHITRDKITSRLKIPDFSDILNPGFYQSRFVLFRIETKFRQFRDFHFTKWINLQKKEISSFSGNLFLMDNFFFSPLIGQILNSTSLKCFKQ